MDHRLLLLLFRLLLLVFNFTQDVGAQTARAAQLNGHWCRAVAAVPSDAEGELLDVAGVRANDNCRTLLLTPQPRRTGWEGGGREGV